MPTPITAQYATVTLPDAPTASDLRRLIEPYQAMIVAQFRAILDRTERSEYYPWIDTKINLITGEDLPPAHPLLGRDLVSGWVQGRGLESVAKFAAWLAPFAGDGEVDRLIARARRLAADLLAQLRQARTVNGGHLYFFMTPAGQAFDLGPDMQRTAAGAGCCVSARLQRSVLCERDVRGRAIAGGSGCGERGTRLLFGRLP